MKLIAGLLVLFAILAGILGPQAFFVVDETELAIVTRFGEARRSLDEPGLYVKTPFIDTVTTFEKRLLLFDAPPDSLLTEDKKNLIIDVYARARIVDPLTFFRLLGSEARAASRVIDIVTSELRKEIALDEQSEIIRTSREVIMNRVRDASGPQLREFGLEVVDVRIKRADFPEQIAESIYARMRAERERIANRERAEGAQRDLEIRSNVDRRATIIRAEAEREANILRGEGEAQAISIFADALERDPEFYTFQRSLEAYKNFLTQNSTVVLPANSDLFQFITSPNGGVSRPQEPQGQVSFAALAEMLKIENAARDFLANEKAVPSQELTLMDMTLAQWQDSSLGCPVPGQSYAQGRVSGFSLTFSHNGTLNKVHTNSNGTQFATCQA